MTTVVCIVSSTSQYVDTENGNTYAEVKGLCAKLGNFGPNLRPNPSVCLERRANSSPPVTLRSSARATSTTWKYMLDIGGRS
jgi:hypothetical protein